ncbi:15532_t:CDS:2 [Gigaspora rosea]|nr:15532_t:CDS:2 [Gigaspora rosea]
MDNHMISSTRHEAGKTLNQTQTSLQITLPTSIPTNQLPTNPDHDNELLSDSDPNYNSQHSSHNLQLETIT